MIRAIGEGKRGGGTREGWKEGRLEAGGKGMEGSASQSDYLNRDIERVHNGAPPGGIENHAACGQRSAPWWYRGSLCVDNGAPPGGIEDHVKCAQQSPPPPHGRPK